MFLIYLYYFDYLSCCEAHTRFVHDFNEVVPIDVPTHDDQREMFGSSCSVSGTLASVKDSVSSPISSTSMVVHFCFSCLVLVE